MSRIAIIAALEREIGPLVRERGWTRGILSGGGRNVVCFRQGELVALVGGIGAHQAEIAARAAVAEFQPQALISAGLAGAMIRTLKVESLFFPNVIVDATTGAEYRCHTAAESELVSGGILVSGAEIAGPQSKKELADRFHGLVVDMEAAAVARVAQETKTSFFCVKAISDELDAALPPLSLFTDEAGRFHTGKFLIWGAMRPQWWPATIRLARDGRRATYALCDWLRANVTGGFVAAPVVTLDGGDFPKP